MPAAFSRLGFKVYPLMMFYALENGVCASSHEIEMVRRKVVRPAEAAAVLRLVAPIQSGLPAHPPHHTSTHRNSPPPAPPSASFPSARLIEVDASSENSCCSIDQLSEIDEYEPPLIRWDTGPHLTHLGELGSDGGSSSSNRSTPPPPRNRSTPTPPSSLPPHPLLSLSERIRGFASTSRAAAQLIASAPLGTLGLDMIQRTCATPPPTPDERQTHAEEAALVSIVEREGLELKRTRGAWGIQSKTGFAGVYLAPHTRTGKVRDKKQQYSAFVGAAKQRKRLGRFPTAAAAALSVARHRALGAGLAPKEAQREIEAEIAKAIREQGVEELISN